MGCVQCVPNDQVYVVERCGKFHQTATAGFLCLPIPCIWRVAGRVSKRILQLEVSVETKTSDNVFVNVGVSVQYAVQQEKIYEAYYSLADAAGQIQSYVFDVVRSTVPTQTLDTVFESKDEIAMAVKRELTKTMDEYGYTIIKTLITDVAPDHHVKNAMNAINASKRDRMAAQERAEADKLLTVKKAEADAEAKYLQGEGIARQRKAIIEGLQESVADFQDMKGLDTKEVLDLVLITQYFDTLKELGASSGNQTVFIPHNPGALGQLADEIRSGVIGADQLGVANAGQGGPPWRSAVGVGTGLKK
eukprot:GHVN01049641.1.p1 GENE.GHVN01049641.1~~GHVN01049641.1.p1  ORF type:complete len:305 (+),score=38.78 GHVN01049641.1:178-1092(+)